MSKYSVVGDAYCAIRHTIYHIRVTATEEIVLRYFLYHIAVEGLFLKKPYRSSLNEASS